MKKLFLVGVALFLVLCDAKPAETEVSPPSDAPEVPEGSLLRKPANFSKWEITYGYADDKGKTSAKAAGTPSSPSREDEVATSGRTRKVTILHTEPMWRVEAEDTRGQKSGLWFDGMTMFTEAEGNPMVVQRMAGVTIPLDFGATGFPDLDWINPEAYTKTENYKGISCMVFKKNGMFAWIGLESRYPVGWQKGTEIRSFQELPPPTAALVLPEKMARESQAIRNDIKLLARPKARFTN